MVSLGRNNRSPGGGYFFNADISSNFDDTDDASVVSSALITQSEPHMKGFPQTGWIAIILQTLCIITAFISPFLVIHLSSNACCYLYFVHVGLWGLLFMTGCWLNHHHNVIKRNGYLEFHRKTRSYVKLPFVVFSFGNGILLAFCGLMNTFCKGSDACPVDSQMHCADYSLIVFIAEFVVLMPLSIKYIMVIIRFSRNKSVPDVYHDELLINCIHSQYPTSEVGFREDDYREEILERQADMIRYLKQHNDHLSRKILKLSTELHSNKLAV